MNLRESCMRETCMYSLSGGRRPARQRASSDPTPMKHSNKDGILSAESVEGRLRLKENALSPDTYPTQSGTARVLWVGEGADRLCLAAIYPREEPDALPRNSYLCSLGFDGDKFVAQLFGLPFEFCTQPFLPLGVSYVPAVLVIFV